MVDFFNSVGDVFVNIFSYISSVVDTFVRGSRAILNFINLFATTVNVLPHPWPSLIWSALGLLLAFIVVEILRDFL